MKIRVLPRAFFEQIKGTADEIELLDRCKIISINSSWGWNFEPPFSPALRGHTHLLVLNFDDIANEPETPEDLGRAVMFPPKWRNRSGVSWMTAECRCSSIAPRGSRGPARSAKC